jgi:hypothetical protein
LFLINVNVKNNYTKKLILILIIPSILFKMKVIYLNLYI